MDRYPQWSYERQQRSDINGSSHGTLGQREVGSGVLILYASGHQPLTVGTGKCQRVVPFLCRCRPPQTSADLDRNSELFRFAEIRKHLLGSILD